MCDSSASVLSSEVAYALSPSSSRCWTTILSVDCAIIGGTFFGVLLLVADLAKAAFVGIGDSSSLAAKKIYS
jgi:hypothetical protein